MAEEEKPKIITDEDWKTEAKKEKEKLKQQTSGKNKADSGHIPEANFLTLINTFMLQALLYMGKLADPNDKDSSKLVNLDLAKHNIDLLQVLEDKTKGNLTEEEKKALSLALHEVRLLYVQTVS